MLPSTASESDSSGGAHQRENGSGGQTSHAFFDNYRADKQERRASARRGR